MSTTSKPLINAKFASTGATEYTAPASTRTIIDKFTATNTDGVTRTITVSVVPNGGVQSAANEVIYQKSLSAGTAYDLTELQNHVLATGETLYVSADAASKVVIRASGREVT